MPIDWSVLQQFVKNPERFVITTHMRPDGDALGSALALTLALRSLGKTAQVILPSSIPPRYVTLDPQREMLEYDSALDPQLGPVEAIIVVDTGTWNQLGKFGDWMRRQAVPKLVIDHHRTQDNLGAVQLVDITAEACGRLIYQALQALHVTMTPQMATLLFVALCMDTGWFHHRNVSAETFTLAAELTAAGADPTRLYQDLYDNNTLARQKLTGHVLQNLEVLHNGHVCHASVTVQDYERFGARPLDSEDLVNLTLTVVGVQIGLLFLEQPAGGTKISLRSRGSLDCSKLAEQFGGGGHAAAAGAIVKSPLTEVRDKVIQAVLAALTPDS
jgi:bifunctional oligoribonuclease and PAP phosphatase NrnA